MQLHPLRPSYPAAQPQTLAAALPLLGAERRRGHAVPPRRSPGQAAQEHCHDASNLPEAFASTLTPCCAGISPGCLSGEFPSAVQFLIVGDPWVVLTTMASSQSLHEPTCGVQGPGVLQRRPARASSVDSRRRPTPSTLLRDRSYRPRSSVSIAHTSYSFCDSWFGPWRALVLRALLLALVNYPCREPSPRPKPELF